MVTKLYDWHNGAVLDEHSKRKHKILDEYFCRYLTTRCQLPQQQKFRLAIVDGFAGGGRYNCGSPGSPILFIEGLEKTFNTLNIERASRGIGALEIECLFIFNDADHNVIEILKSNSEPLVANANQVNSGLHLQTLYFSDSFEEAYPKIKAVLAQGRYRSILFNLDQSGHSHVKRSTLIDIMRLNTSVEIFYTFMVGALLAYLSKSQPDRLAAQMQYLQIDPSELTKLSGEKSNNAWLGAAERLVFENFRTCAPFVSPFSINNPDGWRYWLIHFANSHRARQVYNDTLHDNASTQAHWGRSGLNMLSYDPNEEGALYLFDVSGREQARAQLIEDIPRLISDYGDVLGVGDFYEGIYNLTPAHKDDIHWAIAENSDLEVITQQGGERRKANTIVAADTIKLKKQRSFWPIFIKPNE